MTWCFAAASVTGTSHLRAGTRRQDAFATWKSDCGSAFLGLVADGAGSAVYGGEGASLLCRTMLVQFRDFYRQKGTLPDEDEIWEWVDLARDRIARAAELRESPLREFAATMVLAALDGADTVTAHIGDGAAVGLRAGSTDWQAVSAPQNGEYAGTTYFVTDSPQPSLRYSRHGTPMDTIAVFTDGIEGLVLDGASSQPHPQFFGPMTAPLRASATVGKDDALSRSLARFLDSDRINERTDDDKTLILAVNK